MNEFNDYLIAQFNSGAKLCKAPFASMVKAGDLVEIKGIYGKGKVVAVETASKNNNLFNLLNKLNYPEEKSYKVKAIYSKKEIEWGTDDE